MTIESPLAANIAFIRFGCCPNTTVCAEQSLKQFFIDGYTMVDEFNDADISVINACGTLDTIIEDAQEIIDIAIANETPVIITGCLNAYEQKNKADMLAADNIITISGNNACEETITVVRNFLPNEHHKVSADLMPAQGAKLTLPHYAYLPLSHSGYQSCSFFSPYESAKQRYRPTADIREEAEQLIKVGVKELILTSADLAASDTNMLLQSIKSLTELITPLETWLRLGNLLPHPKLIDKLMPLMAEGKLLPYLDLSLCHVNRELLQSMNHPHWAEDMLAKIEQWRSIVPELTLRGRFIVGFDGETEEQFQALMDFVTHAQFDRVSVQNYTDSGYQQTKSNEDKAFKELVTSRQQRLLNLAHDIIEEKLADTVGSIQPVIIDDIIEDDEIQNIALGRTINDAPETDGIVQVEEIYGAIPGQVLHVEIVDATDKDLIAVPG